MTPERIAALRAFLETGMRELGVPGASFALTDRGRTLYAGGIGVREIGRTEPVDGDTEFMVASNTKGLSTLLLAPLLVAPVACRLRKSSRLASITLQPCSKA